MVAAAFALVFAAVPASRAELTVTSGDSSYFYVGVGWRLLLDIESEITGKGMTIEGRMTMEKYWPVQEEKTTVTTDVWDSVALHKLAADSRACADAWKQRISFQGEGGFPKLRMTKDRLLEIHTGESPDQDFKTEVPGDQAEGVAQTLGRVTRIQDSINGRLAGGMGEEKPDANGGIPEVAHIRNKRLFIHSDGKHTLAYQLYGRVGTMGLELWGDPQWTTTGFLSSGRTMTDFLGKEPNCARVLKILESAAAASELKKKFEDVDGELLVGSDAKGKLTLARIVNGEKREELPLSRGKLKEFIGALRDAVILETEINCPRDAAQR